MGSRSFTVEGVVIGRRDYGESDKFINLLTEYEGKLTALAKGVRKINSKRLGSLELANKVKVLLYQGKSFGIITEVEILDNKLDFRSSENKLGSMLYICELVNRLVPENQENQNVYHLFLKIRNEIKQGNFNKVVEFESDLLNFLGYGVKSSTNNLLLNTDYKRAHVELKNRIEEIIEDKLISLQIFK
jgi:DNA repair protein RecO (recombination protein O)